MSQNDNPATDDLDDGTWHQPAQGHPTIPPEVSTRVKTPESGSLEETPVLARHTVPGAETTIPPFATAAGKDSADSEEATQKPGSERSDEWDLLPAPTIEQGQVVFGKYLLEEKLGKGGMGEVWLVENLPLQKETALKLIDPKYAQDDKGWRRFEREARVMAKITHPNAVAVYDFRRMHSMAYIEMELVPGCSLEKYLKDRRAPVSLEWTTQLLDQLCSVLQEAHGHVDKKSGKAKPIIHRDLKPSNLMLVEGKPDGQNLKVLDFGIAKMVQDEGSPELTGQGDFVGTPHYMSPEQIRGGVGKDGRGEIDGRSDLYSVGVLLYQLLTGSLPFTGRTNMELLVAHLQHTPAPMREANPEATIPPQVERLVMQCLEKDPDRRPQSARELADRFRAAISALEGPEPKKAGWKTLALPLTAACVLFAGFILVAPRLHNLGRGKSSTDDTRAGRAEEKPATPDGSGPDLREHKGPVDGPGRNAERASFEVWESRGYEALTSSRLETITLGRRGPTLEAGKIPADLGDAPAGLRRKSDGVLFYAFAEGIYLPIGYSALDPNALEGSWPKVLERLSDHVRFIRITGGKYTRGDFRQHIPIADLQGYPCDPHEVEVSGFYIQETEVTNQEIEAFQKESPEARLGGWMKSLSVMIDDAKKPREDVMQYPAVWINRATAQIYARSVSGRLPTEAEWEYAARSRGQSFLWAWKGIVSKKGSPKAFLANNPDAGLYPERVKKFAGDDETDQMVFDMTGNVREWCLDVYKPYPAIIAENKGPDQPLHDPRVGSEPETDNPKLAYVVRGGSFMLQPEDAMVFQRGGVPADQELNDLGFRVVIECPPEP